VTRRGNGGFTLAEALLAISLVAITMGLLGLLFQRSLNVLKVIDDKERARQAGRMGLDRLTSELREATDLLEMSNVAYFEKIDPNAVAVDPPLAPDNPPEDYVPPSYTPQLAYPDSSRLEVRYLTSGDQLLREVRRKGSGGFVRQIVVVGINAFTCRQSVDNPGEVEVIVSVQDSRRVTTLSSRIQCPCIKEPFL
jgi:type II secretory pathway pseudopilin PulG